MIVKCKFWMEMGTQRVEEEFDVPLPKLPVPISAESLEKVKEGYIEGDLADWVAQRCCWGYEILGEKQEEEEDALHPEEQRDDSGAG
jgi:hypothetical protein